MAIGGLSFCQFVIPTERIKAFDEFLLENSATIGTLRLYDKSLYLSPWVMSRGDLVRSIESWESRGIQLQEVKNGVIYWKDLCALPLEQNERLPDWLEYDETKRAVTYKGDEFHRTVVPLPENLQMIQFSSVITGKYAAAGRLAKGIVRIGDFNWCINIVPTGEFCIPIVPEVILKLKQKNAPPLLTLHDFATNREISAEFRIDEDMNIIFHIDATSGHVEVNYRSRE